MCTLIRLYRFGETKHPNLNSGQDQYKRVFIVKDRTHEEMKKHIALLTELRKKIDEFPTTRWAIVDGHVVNKGQFSKSGS